LDHYHHRQQQQLQQQQWVCVGMRLCLLHMVDLVVALLDYMPQVGVHEASLLSSSSSISSTFVLPVRGVFDFV
jgi:hypothetical protein